MRKFLKEIFKSKNHKCEFDKEVLLHNPCKHYKCKHPGCRIVSIKDKKGNWLPI